MTVSNWRSSPLRPGWAYSAWWWVTAGMARYGPCLLLVPGLLALWVGLLVQPVHGTLVLHALVMTFGGTLVGLAHLANLRLNHGHVHDATCTH